MGQALQVYNNPEFGDVRIVGNDGEPLFVGKDVAIALGYSNPRKALANHVPDKYKKDGVTIRDSMGREQTPTLITEAGLYKLVMRSKLPNAEKFSDWVCEDVIPSIRKQGMYINPNAPIDPRFLRRMADEIEQRDKKIAELQPKADYCEKVLESTEHLTSELIAKEYGESAHWLHDTLIKYNVMYMRRRGKKCYYYMKAPYDKGGYRDSETVTLERGMTAVNHFWTQKGRHFVYNFLKRHGVLPLAERDERMNELVPA